ncbi:MAG: DUF1929 domain-containing protein [Acidobacteriia bacterium]|nr:DUF1929 domain-containing protein [Terriglobia bacterium]
MESFSGTTWVETGPNVPQATNLYPRVKLVPGGSYVMAGPSKQTYVWDGNVSHGWQAPSMGINKLNADRHDGAVVLLDGLQKIFAAGGNTAAEGTGCPTNSSELYDIASQSWSAVSQCMCYARYNLNLVLLADGSVLAVGGGDGFGNNYSGPELDAELYNPATQTWSVMRAQKVQRTYHSTALLLPDGRVLSAGSDKNAGQAGSADNTFEIFSPPYLFNSDGSGATQPKITSVPSTIHYGSANAFTIVTQDVATAASIVKVALVRPGAVTHANDFEQRYVTLTFSHPSGTNQLTATPPSDSTVAPPGYYMLFILNSSTPSVAMFTNLQP